MNDHEQIINDICEIAAMIHDPIKFKALVTLLYKKGVLDGNMQALQQQKEALNK